MASRIPHRAGFSLRHGPCLRLTCQVLSSLYKSRSSHRTQSSDRFSVHSLFKCLSALTTLNSVCMCMAPEFVSSSQTLLLTLGLCLIGISDLPCENAPFHFHSKHGKFTIFTKGITHRSVQREEPRGHPCCSFSGFTSGRQHRLWPFFQGISELSLVIQDHT